MDVEMEDATPEVAADVKVDEPPQKKAKRELLAIECIRCGGNSNGDVPPVETRTRTGTTVDLHGCRTVGRVMAIIAIGRQILASQVEVIDPESGRKLAVKEEPLPEVEFVIGNVPGILPSSRLNLVLHGHEGDHATCARLVEGVKTLPDEKMRAAEFALCDAVTNHADGWEICVKTLMQVGICGWRALEAAVVDGVPDGVALLHSIDPTLITRLDYCGNTALSLASENGHVEVVEVLISAARELDQTIPTASIDYEADGRAALLWAINFGRPRVVEKLLAGRANPNHPNRKGNTALFFAVFSRCEESVGHLIAAKADVNHIDNQGQAVMTLGGFVCPPNIWDRLIAAGLNVNYKNAKGNTALLCAANNGCAIGVDKLLAAGADVNYADPGTGTSALMFASAIGYPDVVVKLIAAGADVNHVNQTRESCLTAAACERHAAIVFHLLAAGAQIDYANREGNTAVICAAHHGDVDVVAKLIELRANVQHANYGRDSALTAAVTQGHEVVVTQLLEAGANVDHEGWGRETALKKACDREYVGLMRKLIRAGARIPDSMRDKYGKKLKYLC